MSFWGVSDAEGRTRTDTGQGPLDFESSASTNFTTPAKTEPILAYIAQTRQEENSSESIGSQLDLFGWSLEKYSCSYD